MLVTDQCFLSSTNYRSPLYKSTSCIPCHQSQIVKKWRTCLNKVSFVFLMNYITQTTRVSPAFLCLSVLKAAMCQVRAMAGTLRHWQRRFRSTMIPSTPCTSPELASTLASPTVAPFTFCIFVELLLPVPLLLVCLFLFTLSFSEPTPKQLLDGWNLLCSDV